MKAIEYLKNICRYFVHRGFKNGGITYINLISCDSDKQLLGKTVLITGGGSGIGYAIAEKCIKCGAKVIITGRNKEKLEKAVNKLGTNSYYIVNDISQISNLPNLLEEAIGYTGKIDALVNNAGIPTATYDVNLVDENLYNRVMNTNLKAVYFLTNLFYKYLCDNKIHGSIVMIASNGGIKRQANPYGISKAAVVHYGLGLAKESIKKQIRCNIIAPGYTISSIAPEFQRDKEANLHKWDVTDGRWHLAEEIAEVVEFLLSDRSMCLNGQILECDGGDSIL